MSEEENRKNEQCREERDCHGPTRSWCCRDQGPCILKSVLRYLIWRIPCGATMSWFCDISCRIAARRDMNARADLHESCRRADHHICPFRWGRGAIRLIDSGLLWRG